LREGRRDGDIFVTGNTGIDALRFTVQKDFSHPILEKAAGKKLVLLTAHRRENHGEPFRRILRAVRAAMRAREDALLLFVMHPNPLLQGEAHALLSDAENILLSPPLSPIVFQNLLSRATLLLTDSGGAQEEATALGIPTLVLREETERPEGARAGTLFPVGTDEAALLFHITSFLAHPPKTSPSLCYGDGGASQIILNRLEDYFCR
jgi:UDP-N-acetylglucosamine 2-epimerase (non-hydrolysing)